MGVRRLSVLAAAVAVLVVACSDDGGGRQAATQTPTTRAPAAAATSSGAPGATVVDLVARNIAFDRTAVTVPAGTVTFEYDHRDSGIPHNLHVTGEGVDERTKIEPGPVRQRLSLRLRPGTYTYICDVHPQQMRGELTVTG